MRSLKKLDFRR